MGAVGSVLWQAALCPATSLLLLTLVWVWTKLYLGEWDQRLFTASFTDCVQRKQFWRLLLTVWNCRHVEAHHGSPYFLRYSVVLLLSESLVSFSLIYLSTKLAPGRSAA
ncbi:hypothetical protein B484DRAFT_423809, partial [Ochromonadaceae sp. CCMP2298]